MKVYDVVQGTPEWHALRARHGNRTASGAPVVMNCSPRMSRADLVRITATGDEPAFSAWVQENLLPRGHEVEVFGRAYVEARLGEELYPATIGTDDGYMLASYDGITMDGETGFECKLWNEELAAAVREGIVPPKHHWQLDQQIAIAELTRVIFVVTDGTPEKTVECEYLPNAERIARLVPAWRQFDEDVAKYEHVEVIPKAAATIEAGLPAVVIDVKGEVSLESNLGALDVKLRAFVASIPERPETDEDFANCEKAVKDLQVAEERLRDAADGALARFESVDAMRSAVAAMIEVARQARLRTNKLVESRKQAVRDEIRTKGAEAFGKHVMALNERLGGDFMPMIPAAFAEVMRGKKTVKSLRDAVDGELARVKLEANAVADLIQKNLRFLASHAGFDYLFSDLRSIIAVDSGYFELLVTSRIRDHKEKAEREAEAARERIRAEERQKALAATTPVAPIVVDPATIDTAALVDTFRSTSTAVTRLPAKFRPTDDEIIDVLTLHYRVHESKVIEWLLGLDLKAASGRMAANL